MPAEQPALLPWGPAALEAARQGPGLLVLAVDAAWCAKATAEPRFAWLRAIGVPDEPVHVAVDRDAHPAVALRARWTLRLFELDEELPHAAVYAVARRGGRLSPLFAATTRGSTTPNAARATEHREALVVSARRGWRAHPPLTRHLADALTAVNAAFDAGHRDFTAAPGPLRPAALALLLAAARRGDDAAAALVHRTLDAMAHGGVRDPLDGGFFRAARDPGWRLPDFARSTALNAALLGVYARAASQLGEPRFAGVARDTARYLLGTMRDPKTPGFFASEGVDETYYTWTSHELAAALPFDRVQAACMHFNVQPAARVVADPQKNVLYAAADAEAIARFIGQPTSAVAAQLADARARLLAARTARDHPQVDRTHALDVNAQVVSALLEAARALDEPDWRAAALETLAWLEEGGLPARVDLYLGDAAALGRALLDAHACTGDAHCLARAEAVASAVLERFRDRRSGALLDAPRDSIVNHAFWPEQPLDDMAGPSPAATAIGLLLDLHRRTGRAHYQQAAAEALRSGARAAADDPVAAAGYYLMLAEWLPRV